MLILFTIGEKVIRYVMRNKQGLMITKSFIVFGVLTKITNNQILTIMEQEPILNEHNKQEYPPMHTAEHILNQTMVRMFGCPRSRNAHIEKKKSKCDYLLDACPTEEQVQAIEDKVNEVIDRHLDVTVEYADRDHLPPEVDLSKLPADASETLRLVRIGDYDICACAGDHVANTREIPRFKIISHDWNDGTWRVRFRLVES